MRKTILGALVLVLAAALAGCETVKGVGRDITNTSSAVESALTHRR